MILAENDLTLSEAASRWGVSSANTIKARAAALGVQLRRESSTRTVWPAADVPLGDRLAEHLARPGATLRSFDGLLTENTHGIRTSELMEQLPLSRSSFFELVKALGIVTTKGPGPEGRGRMAWVNAADAERLAEAAGRVHRGEVRIADLAQQERHDAPIAYSHPPSERNQRWPVSLYGCNEHLYCICDDGTLWQLDGEWIQLPEVPQP